MLKLMFACVLLTSGCVTPTNAALHCHVGSTAVEPSATTKVEIDGAICTVQSVAECSVCIGPAQPIPGGSSPECLGHYESVPCLGPFRGAVY